VRRCGPGLPGGLSAGLESFDQAVRDLREGRLVVMSSRRDMFSWRWNETQRVMSDQPVQMERREGVEEMWDGPFKRE
jgi:hypothetical protein